MALAPENTLASIKLAVLSGLSFVEVDVKISKDQIPVLMHDDDIRRTTNGSGLCSKFTYDQLIKFDSGNWFNIKYKNEKILSLEMCLDFLNKHNVGLNIELKPNKKKERENIISIKNVIYKKNYKINFFVSTFDIFSLELSQSIIPLVPRGFLVDTYTFKTLGCDGIIDICSKNECFFIGLEMSLINQDLVNILKKTNLQIGVFTVNDIYAAKIFFSMGVDSIFTDIPDLLIN